MGDCRRVLTSESSDLKMYPVRARAGPAAGETALTQYPCEFPRDLWPPAHLTAIYEDGGRAN